MNEKLAQLLDKVQSTAIEVSDTAADAAYGVGKKAGELLCVAKLKIRIAETQAEINTALQELTDEGVLDELQQKYPSVLVTLEKSA